MEQLTGVRWGDASWTVFTAEQGNLMLCDPARRVALDDVQIPEGGTVRMWTALTPGPEDLAELQGGPWETLVHYVHGGQAYGEMLRLRWPDRDTAQACHDALRELLAETTLTATMANARHQLEKSVAAAVLARAHHGRVQDRRPAGN